VGFEPTISVFERVKKFHALDRAATVIGDEMTSSLILFINNLLKLVENLSLDKTLKCAFGKAYHCCNLWTWTQTKFA
jgi:hypothetical protein